MPWRPRALLLCSLLGFTACSDGSLHRADLGLGDGRPSDTEDLLATDLHTRDIADFGGLDLRDLGDLGPADAQADRGVEASTPDSMAVDRGPPCGVTLQVGDDFQVANNANPPGTVFCVKSGLHLKQRVVDPKAGNRWIGEANAVLDGQDSLSDAFHGTATNVQIVGLELRNYQDNGVFFGAGSQVRVVNVTVRDTGSGDGEANGALRFDNVTDLEVRGCDLARTSSGILATGCTGPLVIEGNRAENIGRNMVQLAACSGGGIRVRYNSMERVGSYLRPGAQDVEDWISVWKVQGTAADPVQISFNRARGHGTSGSGSFIMLGDGGGKYQLAEGNIGVTCGQVGIGLSGGTYITVRANAMYSDVWAASNIAFYSADYGTPPCGNHTVENNRANWKNKAGTLNSFWQNGSCAPLVEQNNTFPDATLTATIWSSWKPSP